MQSREPRESPEAREQQTRRDHRRYFQAKAAGEEPDRDQWISQHPEFAADLVEFFADQDRFRSLANPLRVVACAAQEQSLTACEDPDQTEPDSPDLV